MEDLDLSLAIVNVKSTFIANADTLPAPIITDRSIARGDLLTVEGTVPVATTDNIGSVYRLARVPSSARITSIKVYNTAITTGVYNLGFYFTQNPEGVQGLPVNSGTEIATAQSFATAHLMGQELRYVGDATLASTEMYVFGLIGSTTGDTQINYDLCLTSTTAATVAGTIAFEVTYAPK